LLHPVMDPPWSRHSWSSNVSSHSNQSPRLHTSGTQIKLPTISLLTFEGDTCTWLQFRDTFEALIVNNTTLSNVQKLHYLIASLKNEVKDLISNLQVTHENFSVAWRLVTQCYNNKRLIAMMHAEHLMSDATSQEGGRIITVSINQSCLKPHECLTSIRLRCTHSRFSVEPFNSSYIRCWHTKGLGNTHCVPRHPTANRTNCFLENKMQGIWVTLKCAGIQYVCCPSSVSTVSWNQGQ
jgi:hypothetical protein